MNYRAVNLPRTFVLIGVGLATLTAIFAVQN